MSLNYKAALLSAAGTAAQPLNVPQIDVSTLEVPSSSVKKDKRVVIPESYVDNEGKSGSGQTERRNKKQAKSKASELATESEKNISVQSLKEAIPAVESGELAASSAKSRFDLTTEKAERGTGVGHAGGSGKPPRLTDTDRDEHKNAFSVLQASLLDLSLVSAVYSKSEFSIPVTVVKVEDRAIVNEVTVFATGFPASIIASNNYIASSVTSIDDALLALNA